MCGATRGVANCTKGALGARTWGRGTDKAGGRFAGECARPWPVGGRGGANCTSGMLGTRAWLRGESGGFGNSPKGRLFPLKPGRITALP